MLRVPKSLLKSWSDYREVVTDGEALLNSLLDGESACDFIKFDLSHVHLLGWKSKEAQQLYRSACGELQAWCVEHDGYLNNVSLQQRVGPFDLAEICTPVEQRATAKPSLLQRGARAIGRLRSQRTGSSLRDDKFTYQARVDGDLPSFTSAERMLGEQELVLIDAPVCLDSGPDGTAAAYLCDFPPVLRRDNDPRVPVLLSDGALKALRQALGDVTEWHPFCRLLGIVRRHENGMAIQLLQLSMRTPLRNGKYDDSWGDRLIREASGLFFPTHEASWLGKYVEAFAGQMGTSGDQPGAITPAGAADPAQASPQTLAALLEYLKRNASEACFWLTSDAGFPYEGGDAFWCATALISEGWPQHCALTAPQRAALLDVFDETYNAEWRRVAAWLTRLELVRYTPAVMDEIRQKIAFPRRRAAKLPDFEL